jgi:23S rRNA pseudouridine2457 synthase
VTQPWRVLLAFHKPYGVISRFTTDGSSHATLAGFGFPPRVYPIGRLDADSEGLLLLSDEPALNRRLLHPRQQHPREYWVQVERIPAADTLRQLAAGVRVLNRLTRLCQVRLLEPPPDIPPRQPPIRERKSVPTAWLALELTEGKNRQVRRMTAAVGHPTLRLIRVRIGAYDLGQLRPGTWLTLDQAGREAVLGAALPRPGFPRR